MTQPIDIDQDTYLRQRPRSTAEDFGENVNTPLFTDDTRPGKTAKLHASRVRAGEAEARHDANMRQLQDRNRRLRDAEAAEEVQRRISKGQDISPALAEAAMRHERRQGGLGLSSAQLLAQRAGRS
jgi:hypothetical protein